MMDSKNWEKNEKKKNNCYICLRNKNDCPRCVQIEKFFRYEISDNDFVENPYGYGLKKNVDLETAKAKTKAKSKASTSSVVTDPNLSNSDDEFVPCMFKAHYK